MAVTILKFKMADSSQSIGNSIIEFHDYENMGVDSKINVLPLLGAEL